MKETWLLSALAAALAGAPAPLSKQVQSMEGGSRYVAEALPIVEGDRQYVLFTFCHATGGRLGEERRLYPPFATAHVSYPDKHVQWHEESVKTRLTGLPVLLDNERQPYLGVIKRAGVTPSEWTDARVKYDELIEVVLARKWLLTRHPTSVEEHNVAKELEDCVRIVYDKPLLPYYKERGRQFLTWMERAAK